MQKATRYTQSGQRGWWGVVLAVSSKTCDDDDTHFKELTSRWGLAGGLRGCTHDHQSTNAINWFLLFISLCLFVIVWARLQNGKHEKNKSDSDSNSNSGKPKPTTTACKCKCKWNWKLN